MKKEANLLRVIKGPDKGKVFELTERVTVLGRGDQANVALSEASISRKHASIQQEGGAFILYAMSENPTLVNGKDGRRFHLADNDRVQLGEETVIEVSLAGVAAKPAPERLVKVGRRAEARPVAEAEPKKKKSSIFGVLIGLWIGLWVVIGLAVMLFGSGRSGYPTIVFPNDQEVERCVVPKDEELLQPLDIPADNLEAWGLGQLARKDEVPSALYRSLVALKRAQQSGKLSANGVRALAVGERELKERAAARVSNAWVSYRAAKYQQCLDELRKLMLELPSPKNSVYVWARDSADLLFAAFNEG